MSMIEYFSKKAKKVSAFEKLRTLRETALKMIADLTDQTREFTSYFEDKYPGIEDELNEVISHQYTYHKASLENEAFRKLHPDLKSEFAKIDEAFEIDRIVKTGSIEKYQIPEKYNANNANRAIHQVLGTTPIFGESPKTKALSKYASNAMLINQFYGKVALKDAVSGDLYNLLMDAIYKRSAIRIQHPHVNRAIDEYNQQYEYCYDMYMDDTKTGLYKSIMRVSLDSFEENKYNQLLNQAFDPTKAKERVESDLSKQQTPATM